jgi:hypothetical protein
MVDQIIQEKRMSRREKITLAISFVLAPIFAVVNITTDYINKHRFLEILMIASFAQVMIFLNEVAEKSRKKVKGKD